MNSGLWLVSHSFVTRSSIPDIHPAERGHSEMLKQETVSSRHFWIRASVKASRIRRDNKKTTCSWANTALRLGCTCHGNLEETQKNCFLENRALRLSALVASQPATAHLRRRTRPSHPLPTPLESKLTLVTDSASPPAEASFRDMYVCPDCPTLSRWPEMDAESCPQENRPAPRIMGRAEELEDGEGGNNDLALGYGRTPRVPL